MEVHDEVRLAPGHERDDTPPAPGDLELVRSFLSVHDHVPSTRDSLPPSAETIAWWLREQGLVAPNAPIEDGEIALARDVLEALRDVVGKQGDGDADPRSVATLNRAAREVGLAPAFGSEAFTWSATGVRGAVATLLAVAFRAGLDGTWDRFKFCASPTCRGVFWDRSKNRSGRWCSMSQCGNRAKVRAWRARERERAGA